MTSRGVAVFNTPGANANAVNELVICGMLLSSRKIHQGINYVSDTTETDVSALKKETEAAKSRFKGWEMRGKTVGIVGLGAIGAQVANSAYSGFGMSVAGFDPFLSAEFALQVRIA